jgi:hypothetical protein
MTVPEMIARGVMSLTPLGLPVSMLGRTQKSIAPIGAPGALGAIGTGYNYDATLDPASPSYAGSTGMFSGIVDALTGGAGTQAYSTAKAAVEEVLSSREKEKEREEKGFDQFSISPKSSVGIEVLDPIGKSKADEIKDAFDRSIKENVEIPSNISFSDLMNATTLGTPEYEATKGGDFSSITSGSTYFN